MLFFIFQFPSFFFIFYFGCGWEADKRPERKLVAAASFRT